MRSSSSLLLHGLVILDGLLGASQADQRGAQPHIAGASVVLRLLAFALAAGQFLSQSRHRLVHGGDSLYLAGIRI